jgi:hypothetical protein
LVNVSKRYLIAVAAHNLGRILRKLFGIGKPRVLQGEGGLAALAAFLMMWLLAALRRQRRHPLGPAEFWPAPSPSHSDSETP